MIRAGVLSDSHGDWDSLERLLWRMGRLNMVFFLGDIAQDSEWLAKNLCRRSDHPVLWAVRGNNDLACELPNMLTVPAGEKLVFLTHGHLFHVRSGTEELVRKAKEERASIALYGHTHEAYCAWESGILVINPGAAGNPYGNRRARGCVLEIAGDRISVSDCVI